jgi:putative zinc finger/helix-turn-helix YgiT family protein
MLCLRCKNDEFVESVVDTPQEFRGDSFTVKVPAMSCTQCGWQTMTDAQADKLSLTVADAYRKKHDLLASDEIRQARQRFGLSQQVFAQRLSVGVASLKRWETGFVQEKSSDDLIRLKVNQMADTGAATPSLLDWFTDNCAKGTVTLAGAGLQLSPRQEPAHPAWRSPTSSRPAARSLRKVVNYDPDLPLAA